ncbi:hypothetical protein DPEC_G00335570 [Dallia pectoralis]|uniref:Uncharacterized protein n=1 Tax=Dallia pectoralis TaxID=75939 RepID=A0ACC2F701_DALPE|nr:hypothetical protein DPEC_G00335570 [Dallia pectoralis]
MSVTSNWSRKTIKCGKTERLPTDAVIKGIHSDSPPSSLAEQNADRKNCCRNNSLHRRQTNQQQTHSHRHITSHPGDFRRFLHCCCTPTTSHTATVRFWRGRARHSPFPHL